MAEENSQPKGLAALLQTLDPERQEILLFLLERDHRAALGAELVGARAFSPKDTEKGTKGWTSRIWGDITLSEESPESKKRKQEQDLLRLASKSLQQANERPEIENWRARQQASEKAELEANSKENDQIQADFMSNMDVDKYLTELEANENAFFKIRAKYGEATFPKGPPAEDYRTAAEKLLYKDGILQPFVLFGRGRTSALDPKSKASILEEMQTLAHELGHVSDTWQTVHRADMDVEFSGKAGPSDFGLEDYEKYGYPRLLSMKEIYKSGPGESGKILDEPYARLMDRYNKERLLKKGYQPYPSLEKEKLGYIPDRLQWSTSETGKRRNLKDPFATKDYSTVESRDAAAHPAQGGALMELNRRMGRDPLEGMDAWLQRHGR